VLSVVCYWEVVIKVRKVLLAISDPVMWRSRAIDALGGSVLSIRAAHISALSALPDLHRDPFDRILIAQAAAEGFTLVTSDEQIRRYAVKTIW
jgi:PIN domain nuclease of toxin-antitoxin system